MKRCPECRKDYFDDSLLYCLDDGAALIQGSVTDEQATAILSASSDENLTAAFKTGENETRANSVTLRLPAFLSGERLSWFIAAVMTIVAAFLAYGYFRRPVPDERPVSFVIPPPESATFIGTPTISPDGRTIVFNMTLDGKSRLYIRELGSFAEQPLNGTEDPTGPPFWSPDSRTIAFIANDKLKKVDIGGGPAQVICNALRAFSGAWSRDGVILFGGLDSGIRRVSAAGGETSEVLALDQSRKEIRHLWPRFLPDGRHFLYRSHNSSPSDPPEIFVASIDGKERKPLFKTSSDVNYIAPGYLLFDRSGTLTARPFDAAKLEFTGEPFAVVENVAFNTATGRAQFSVSDNGTLAYRQGSTSERQLTWFDREGKEILKFGPPGNYQDIVLSPDGKKVVAARYVENNTDVWVMDIDRGVPTRFTFTPEPDDDPAWSSDGRYLIYTSTRGSNFRRIYRKVASGAGNEELLNDTVNAANNGLDWSPDGKNILYASPGDKTGDDIWILPVGGDEKPYPLLQSGFKEGKGHFSPDGRFFAYVSNESGREEIYVQTFPVAGGKWQVSTGGGDQPHWRRDGKELYYIAPDNKLMAVSVKLGETFEVGAATPLFQTQVSSFTNTNRYDVAADGQRFLVNAPVQTSKESPFIVVLNWTSTLKR